MNVRIALLSLLLPSFAAAGVPVEIPVDVGIGPAGFFFFGPVFEDQPVHYGLKLDVAAVIDQEFIRQNQRSIPPKYRKLSKSVNEVRISPGPLILLPDSLILSPKLQRTGIYGATWRPVSLGTGVGTTARLSLNAGLLLTYAYLYSDVLPTTHFIRPGLDLKLELELKASKSFLVSMGWASGFYVPQELGGFGLPKEDPLMGGIFHVGQAFLMLHFRFPYKTSI